MYERYCKIRDSRGFTDAQIAGICEFPQSTLSDWKKGKSTPKTEKLARIAECLGVSLDYLVTGNQLTSADERDISNSFSEMIGKISNDSGLMFYGNDLDDETRDYLESAMKTMLANAKIMAKEKYSRKK